MRSDKARGIWLVLTAVLVLNGLGTSPVLSVPYQSLAQNALINKAPETSTPKSSRETRSKAKKSRNKSKVSKSLNENQSIPPSEATPSLQPSSDLLPTKSCQLTNANQNDKTHLGWPRPAGTKNMKNPRVFVVPFLFSDSDNAPVLWEDDLLLQLSRVKDFYVNDSYNQTNFQFTLPWGNESIKNDPSKIIRLPFPFKNSIFDFNGSAGYSDPAIQEFFKKWFSDAPSDWNLTQFDDVHFIVLDFRFISGAFVNVDFQFPWGPIKSFTLVNRHWDASTHEFGHSIFRWNDSYDYGNSVPYGNGFDLMSVHGFWPIVDRRLFAWHRWLAGWIADDEIRCVSPTIESAHRIRNLISASKRAAAVVAPLSETKAIVVESRDGKSLTYVVDTSKEGGGGGIRVYFNNQFKAEEPNSSLIVKGVKVETRQCNKTYCEIKISPLKR